MDEPADIAPDRPVPALFLLTMGRTRRPQPAKGSAVNAGDDFEFLAPVMIGDVIAIERRMVEIEDRQGKQGKMYLAHTEATYTNQRGEVVARSKQNILRWGW
jgi:acyl dehydratase